MPKYFQYFQKEDFQLTNQGTRNLTNLAQYTRIFSKIADDISFYTYYTMDNSERLDTISEKLYGTSEYYWTFLLVNKELSNTFMDIRKDNNEFNNFLQRKYPDTALTFTNDSDNISLITTVDIDTELSNNLGTVTGIYPTMNYITVTGLTNSSPVGETISASGSTVTVASAVPHYEAPHHKENADGEWVRSGSVGALVSIRTWEQEQNDEKYQLKVIRPQYIQTVARQFEREMKRSGV